MKRLLVAISCIGLLSSVAPANYWCDPSLKTPKQRFDTADAVFVGVVVRLGKELRGGGLADFRVTRVFKGKLRNKVSVAYTSVLEDAVHFEKGKSYLVYAVGQSDDLMTDRNCGTKSLDLAKEDLAAISPNDKR